MMLLRLDLMQVVLVKVHIVYLLQLIFMDLPKHNRLLDLFLLVSMQEPEQEVVISLILVILLEEI